MKFFHILLAALLINSAAVAQNQTGTLSPVLSEDSLPFTLQLEAIPFSLPVGLQSYASAIYKNRWIFLAGRTNGLHGFDNNGNNFPPEFQNTTIYIFDPATGSYASRDLKDPSSGLSQATIDTLSVTSSQSFQIQGTLYMVGGYGIDTATNDFGTKSTLTAIDLKKIMAWVYTGAQNGARSAIRQISHPLLQVTGGFLYRASPHNPFLLMLGQNFIGKYVPNSNGIYTEQIRPFWLQDDGRHLAIIPHASSITYPDYRRRDLNVVPVLHKLEPGYVALAGVFTLESGVWTVPILITADGESTEPDPDAAATFKQAMNQYNCPAFCLYSVKRDTNYIVLPGGISYGYFANGAFQTDSEFPFINQITTIQIDKNGQFTQHLMNAEYPFIASTGTNPGNQLLFGAEAEFFPAYNVPLFQNNAIQFDNLPKTPVIIGYIAGGIMSTLPNTATQADSTASPYIFTVKLIPK